MIVFVIHNIIRYMIIQKRYKSWLISIFYFLSTVVLVARICQYCYTIKLYTQLDTLFNKTSHFHLLFEDFTPLINLVRHLGLFFITADYNKFALGWFQLASMAELAIAIQFEVNHLITFRMTQTETQPDALTESEISQ